MFALTLTSLKTNTNTFANSEDADEMDDNEPMIRIYTVCCYYFFFFLLLETPICNNECVIIQRRKSPFQKLEGEMVKSLILKRCD